MSEGHGTVSVCQWHAMSVHFHATTHIVAFRVAEWGRGSVCGNEGQEHGRDGVPSTHVSWV